MPPRPHTWDSVVCPCDVAGPDEQPAHVSERGGSPGSRRASKDMLSGATDIAAGTLRELEAHLEAARRLAQRLARDAPPLLSPSPPPDPAAKLRHVPLPGAWAEDDPMEAPPSPAASASRQVALGDAMPLLPLLPAAACDASVGSHGASRAAQALMAASASEASLGEKVWPTWLTQEPRKSYATSLPSSSSHSPEGLKAARSTHSHQSRVVFQEMIRTTGCMRHIILHPSCLQRVLWDIMSLIVVSFDVLTLPLSAFRFDELDAAATLRLMTTVFWTVDIFITFITGYHEGGVVVGIPTRIARRYIMRLFALDVTIVTVDWAMMATAGQTGQSHSAVDIARLGKVLRAIRLLRILRLLRVMKFVDLSTKFKDILLAVVAETRSIFQLLGILRLMLIVVVANHFLACAWYALGESGPRENSWLVQLDPDEDRMIYKYAVSFHWTMSQFTPAPNNFHPISFQERLFAIAVLVFGFTMFSSFLGSITGLLTHIRNTAVKRSEEDMRVREFLSQNNVSMLLGNRIVTYLRQNQNDSRGRILEKDVRALSELPGSLRNELHFEVYLRVFEANPLMATLAEDHQGLICEASDTIISQRCLAKGHELFHAGEPCGSAFAAMTEGMRYKWCIPGEGAEATEDLGFEQWFCEAALWVRWVHRGSVVAVSLSTVSELRAEGFRALAQKYTIAFDLLRAYALLFARRLDELRPDRRLDTWCSTEVATQLVEQAVQASEIPAYPSQPSDDDDAERTERNFSSAAGALAARAVVAVRNKLAGPRTDDLATSTGS